MVTSSIIIALLVVIVICAITFWISDQFPAPFNWLAKLVVGVLAIVYLASHFLA